MVFRFDNEGMVETILRSASICRIAPLSYALSPMTSRVWTPAMRSGNSLPSAAFPGTTENRHIRPLASVRAIIFEVSPPLLRPIACFMGESGGVSPLRRAPVPCWWTLAKLPSTMTTR